MRTVPLYFSTACSSASWEYVDTQCSTFRQPHRKSLAYRIGEHEQVHLLTDLTVVTFLVLLQQCQILIQHLLFRESDTTQTNQLNIKIILTSEKISFGIFLLFFHISTFLLIPANAEHKENAEKWIDFLCRPDIAKKNFEYITYATPNKGAYDLLDDDLKNNKALFPDINSLPNCEIIKYLGDDVDMIYNDMWKEIKSE